MRALQGFEIIKAVHLESEPFTVENDLITPSFKLKRAPLQKRYQAAITRMYAQLNKNKSY
jgi:long-chain acyl-CoA synthetase